MKTLTVTRALGTANRWQVIDAKVDEENEIIQGTARLINNTGVEVSRREFKIRNGLCDVLRLDGSPAALGDVLVTTAPITLPTGFADAFDACRVQSTKAARYEALETWMLSATVAHSTLAGS